MDYDFDGPDLGEGLEDTPPRQMQWLQQSVTAEFEITLDTILGSSDGEPYTVGDAIIDRVAEKIAADAGRRTEEGYRYYKQVDDKVASILDEKVDALVEKLWQKQVEENDRFGSPTGEKQSLEAWAAARIEKWLNERTDYGRGNSRLDKAIDGVLTSRLDAEMKQAIEGAKQQALAAVTKVAEQHLTKALRDSIAAAGKAE